MSKPVRAHLLLQREQEDEATSDSEKFSYWGVEWESEGNCCKCSEQACGNHDIMALFTASCAQWKDKVWIVSMEMFFFIWRDTLGPQSGIFLRHCKVLKCQVNKGFYGSFHLYCTCTIQQLLLPVKLIIGKVNAKWPQAKRQKILLKKKKKIGIMLSLCFPSPQITLSVIQQSFYLFLLMENCDNNLWIIGV